MGVPKFYRWISERYPCLSEVVKEFQIPDFDNLYLDMNGIIHPCSHPNDDDPLFRITEEKIFANICHYIDFLFKMIKPRKVFFMAVDGVAPRAKMNQQRGRRFRTAKTAVVLEEQAQALGQDIPTEARFDSNCITPGTEFMTRLQTALQGFVAYKISTDKLWQNIRVFLSGHETPGEGEHKVMDFIRYEKSQPGYNPNTRHCLYGLDADLIMLGLCSHEPYFSLLREEVKFGGKKNQKRIMTPEETTFHLLHLSLLRDYLSHEFSPVKDKISFKYDIESVIDDFVLMSFLVGNDFIPHLPQLHIHHDALPVLFRTYIDVLPSLNGYINEQGSLNLERFETFLKKLAEYDFKKFEELNDDFEYLESKSKLKEIKDAESEKVNTSDFLSDLGFSSMAINKMAEFDSSSDQDEDEKIDSSDDDCSLMELEFNMHKTDYYMNKLDFEQVTPEVLRDQAEGYVRAIQWNLHYYYNGVVSWSWYYPHHYSPYISDIRDFKDMNMDFDIAKPFLPYQQLLAVLPKLSKELLPISYQKLMCEKDSPLIDYYPDDFETDLNGKQQEWEAIVLIPFINEKLLLKFAEMADKDLTVEERNRNRHGPHNLYTYSTKSSGPLPSFLPGYYPDLSISHYKVEKIEKDFFRIPSNLIVKGLCKGVILDKIILGFPTLKTLEHTAKLKNEKIKVFQMVSMKDNMMLTIKGVKENDLQIVGEEIVGKVIFVKWPHLCQAFVVSVSDGSRQILLSKTKSSADTISFIESEMTADEKSIWQKQVESVEEHNYQRWGIFVGPVYILVHARCLSGVRYIWSKEGKLEVEKQWDTTISNFALQTTVLNVDEFNPDGSDIKDNLDFFAPDSVVFILVLPYYGNMGKVTHSDLDKNIITVDIAILTEPDLQPVIQNQEKFLSEQYKPGYVAAQQLGIDSYYLSRLTGTYLIQTSPKGSSNPNRVNIGLNLKFNRKNEEVLGFTKKKDNQWLYSEQAIKLLDTYLSEFPEFFEKVSRFVKEDVVYLEDLYPDGEGHELMNKITDWLKCQLSASAERQKCGMTKLDAGIVAEIEQRVQLQVNQEVYHLKKDFSAEELYNPYLCKGITRPDPTTTFSLFDRVVNVSHSSCVPLGLRGTIVGISPDESEADRMYEIVFDKEFFGGLALSCSTGKGYRLPGYSLINISHKTSQKPKTNDSRNVRVSRSSVFDNAIKQLKTNIVPPVQILQKQSTPPLTNKPFYNVNEMFHTSPNASTQNSIFSPLSESANKQFVTPKAGYVANASPKTGYVANASPKTGYVANALPKTGYVPNASPMAGYVPNASPKAGYVVNAFSNKPMLKINKTDGVQPTHENFWADLKRGSSEVSPKPPSSGPVYGKKLSVEELFHSAAPIPELRYQQPAVIHKMPSANSQQHSDKSFVEVLFQLCIEHFNAPPTYAYHNFGKTNLYIATISLPNGSKVTSGPCEQKHEAALNAAEKAINFRNMISNNFKMRDSGMFSRPPPPLFPPNNFRPPMFPPPPFPFDPLVRPLMRHPNPINYSTLMPDSFVASNQMMGSLSSPSFFAPAPSVSNPPPTLPDSELYYMPGGGTARIKAAPKSQLVKANCDNLFVPAVVMKQAVKAPFDSSGELNSDWPDLPSRTEDQPNNSTDSRTLPPSIKPLVTQQHVVKNTVSHPSTMTVLTKKPKRRIAANFQNP